ncbi:MAG: hypothetical protein K9K37_01175 [Desulfocapsa sp.]|nr:hypothetical protein [Desulfocapsa sp.]
MTHSKKNKDHSASIDSSSENPLQTNREMLEEQQRLTKIIETQEKRIKELEVQSSAKDRTISWDDADISKKAETINQLQNIIATQNQTIIELEQQTTLLQESRSFKIGRAITSPLRFYRQIIHSRKEALPGQTVPSDQGIAQEIPPYTPGLINLGGQLAAFYGKHRSGWGYAVMHLAPLTHYNGIYLDTFIERTFVWQPEKIEPTLKPWIGFIHIPPNMPEWFHSVQTNDAIFASDVWQKSYPFCKGLFTLSAYHKKNLETKLDIPINSLLHPTALPPVTWQWELFEKNPERKIVQVGWWLRKLHAIFELPESEYKKIFLNVGSDPYFNKIFAKERSMRKEQGLFTDSMYETAEKVNYLPDELYDQLLSENIMFADLYDSSANNLVIECIVRGTPLLINPIEPIIEYLGKDYPFYFTSYEEAVHKANDLDLVRRTHEYLKNLPIKERLTGEYFLESFKNSEIFKSL